MNNVIEMGNYARRYCLERFGNHDVYFDNRFKYTFDFIQNLKLEVKDIHLDSQLNYRLCGAFDRIFAEFGEVTRHDIVNLIEAWYIAQPDYRKPMYFAQGCQQPKEDYIK